jgi:hypothetical protein
MNCVNNRTQCGVLSGVKKIMPVKGSILFIINISQSKKNHNTMKSVYTKPPREQFVFWE